MKEEPLKFPLLRKLLGFFTRNIAIKLIALVLAIVIYQTIKTGSVNRTATINDQHLAQP